MVHHHKGTYPKSVFALLGIQFGERYNYFALRGILCFYLTDVLLFEEHTAKIIYHTFAAAVHLLPLIGAIVAQSFLGRYRTILLFSLIYVAGSIALGVSAMRIEGVSGEEWSFYGLVLIAAGSGGINPCVEGFAVDQFNMPANHRQMDAYLRLFYFAVRVGTFISLAITPMCSKRFGCLDEITCYPLAFFVPAGAMFLAIRILCFYLTDVLLFEEHTAKIIYHTFAAAVHLLPLIGAIVAQSFLGRYRTILLFSLIYVAGSIALGVSAMRIEGVSGEEWSFYGLVLIAAGSGGINPCVEGFAVDQFNMPANHRQMDAYLRLFYFAVRVGTFISLAITPMCSKRFGCLDEITCYPLAFFVPAGAMFLAILTYRAARHFYRILPAEGHMLLKVITCICAAMKNKITRRGRTEHWLDASLDDYGEELVRDSKALMHFFVLFLPFPIFWALYEQQATTWTFQARKLDGNFGQYFSILPEQMQVANPTLVLILVPVFEVLIYPFFTRHGLLKTPLQRMTTGCFLAVIAFIPPIVLQFAIDNFGARQLRYDMSMLRVFNCSTCDIKMRCDYYSHGKDINVTSMDSHIGHVINFGRQSINISGSCINPLENTTTLGDVPQPGKYLSCYCYNALGEPCWCKIENVEKVVSGNSYVRVIPNVNQVLKKPFRVRFFNRGMLYRQVYSTDQTYEEMDPGTYDIRFALSSMTYRVTFIASGVYTLLVVPEKDANFRLHIFEIFSSSNIHMSAMLPQYLLMSVAEVMFVVAGLELVHVEAPHSMKSVVLLFWLLSIGIGQVLVVFIEIIDLFGREVYRLILYAVMMLGGSLVFILVARSYDYINFQEDLEEIPYTENTGEEEPKSKKKAKKKEGK